MASLPAMTPRLVLPGSVLAFVLLFAVSVLFGFPAVQGLDNPPWQDFLLDEDETDPLESKLSLAVPDGQPALPGASQVVLPVHHAGPLAQSSIGPFVRTLVSASTKPRAPPVA